MRREIKTNSSESSPLMKSFSKNQKSNPHLRHRRSISFRTSFAQQAEADASPPFPGNRKLPLDLPLIFPLSFLPILIHIKFLQLQDAAGEGFHFLHFLLLLLSLPIYLK